MGFEVALKGGKRIEQAVILVLGKQVAGMGAVDQTQA